MARFGDGLAVELDLARAARIATVQALTRLDGPADLLCVFVCTDDPDDVAIVAREVASEAPGAAMLGCSAGGVIGGGQGVELTPSVSVWAAMLPDVRIRTFHLEAERDEDSISISGLHEPRPDDKLAIVLADPYSFPIDGFVERSNEALPGLPFVGGIVSGLQGAGSARLILDGEVHEAGAIGALLGGELRAAMAVSQGCRPIGPPMTVTAAEQNLLLGLAGSPAMEKLREVLDSLSPQDRELAATGLHIGIAMDEYAESHEQGDFLVRGVIGVAEGRAGLAVGDIVPVGRTVRFQIRDAATATEDLGRTLDGFRRRPGYSDIGGALLFTCNGRGGATFGTPDHDVRAVRDRLGTRSVAGFFADGEIGPVSGRNHLHGFTACVVAFAAEEDG